jgi:hypothetical protein
MEMREGKTNGRYTARNFVTNTFHQILLTAIKSRRMKWADHAVRMGEMKYTRHIFVKKS